MSGTRLRPLLWHAAVLVVLAAAAGACGRAAAAAKPRGHHSGAVSLPSAEFLKAVSAGYDDCVADLLWFRAMQYYGEYRRGGHGLEWFTYIVDSVVALDPSFEEAYRFTAMVLAEDMGKPDEAIRLLERGMVKNPRSWWLPFEAGFVEYMVRLDDRAAYRWFRTAASVPGAPDFPKRFAAFMAGRSGDLQVSLVLWQTLSETTPSPALKEKARQKVAELQAAIDGQGPVPNWAVRPRLAPLREEHGGS